MGAEFLVETVRNFVISAVQQLWDAGCSRVERV